MHWRDREGADSGVVPVEFRVIFPEFFSRSVAVSVEHFIGLLTESHSQLTTTVRGPGFFRTFPECHSLEEGGGLSLPVPREFARWERLKGHSCSLHSWLMVTSHIKKKSVL